MEQQESRLLFVVEDRFSIRGRGTVLTPGVPLDVLDGRRLWVRIERPEGPDLVVQAHPEHPSGFRTAEAAERWARGPRAVFVEASPESVPIGSRVWTTEPPQT